MLKKQKDTSNYMRLANGFISNLAMNLKTISDDDLEKMKTHWDEADVLSEKQKRKFHIVQREITRRANQ